MKYRNSLRMLRHQAFTLVEMMTVVGILVLIVALATPPMIHMMEATRLTNAGDLVQGTLSEARGLAITFAADVEVRI